MAYWKAKAAGSPIQQNEEQREADTSVNKADVILGRHQPTTGLKQLKPEFMRNPSEKELFSSPEGKHYEPIPSGEIRSPGDFVRYTGPDVVEEGMFGPKVTRKAGDIISTGMGGFPKADKDKVSEEVGPVEDVDLSLIHI
mgnify:CR=1 FL=1